MNNPVLVFFSILCYYKAIQLLIDSSNIDREGFLGKYTVEPSYLYRNSHMSEISKDRTFFRKLQFLLEKISVYRIKFLYVEQKFLYKKLCIPIAIKKRPWI